MEFDSQLTPYDLDELAVLNVLSGHHSIGGALNCDLDDSQLQEVRDALHECYTFQPQAHHRQES